MIRFSQFNNLTNKTMPKSPEMGMHVPDEKSPEEKNKVRISFLESKTKLSPAEEAELKARREKLENL